MNKPHQTVKTMKQITYPQIQILLSTSRSCYGGLTLERKQTLFLHGSQTHSHQCISLVLSSAWQYIGNTSSSTDTNYWYWTWILSCKITQYVHNSLGYWASLSLSAITDTFVMIACCLKLTFFPFWVLKYKSVFIFKYWLLKFEWSSFF